MTGMTEGAPVDGLRVELRDGVLELTLNRPSKRNALTDAMVEGLIRTLERANNVPTVRAVLLTGSGDDFCSGFDILAGGGARPGPSRAGAIQRKLPSHAHLLVPLLLEIQLPVVCAVRGWAAGVGLQLALAADFAIVAEDSRLWAPFADRALVPDGGASWILPRLAGVARARDLVLLGRQLDGVTAADWALVHRAVPSDDVAQEAAALTTRLASGPTVSLGLARWLLNTSLSGSLRDQLAHEALATEVAVQSEDYHEGMEAFAHKRPPRFTGR